MVFSLQACTCLSELSVVFRVDPLAYLNHISQTVSISLRAAEHQGGSTTAEKRQAGSSQGYCQDNVRECSFTPEINGPVPLSSFGGNGGNISNEVTKRQLRQSAHNKNMDDQET